MSRCSLVQRHSPRDIQFFHFLRLLTTIISFIWIAVVLRRQAMIMTLSYKLCTSVAQCICITISDQQEMGCCLVLRKPLIRLCVVVQVLFSSFLLRRLVIAPVGNIKKLPRNALFSNAIEVKKCRDVFEEFQNTDSTCFITI